MRGKKEDKKKKISSTKKAATHEKVNLVVGQEMIGKIDITKSGDAFVIVEGVEKDFFIFRKNIAQALHNDTVKIQRIVNQKQKRPEAIVLEVVERAKIHFLGVVQKSNNFCFVVPDDKNMRSDFFVPEANCNNAKNGEKVVVELVEWNKKDKNPKGKITEILGIAGGNDIEMKSILIENGFILNFTKEALEEAENLPSKITKEEIAKRKDYRDILTFTIDPADAKDFDDAISYQELANETYEIGVHIADVSHYVKENSILDKEAYLRATSVYLVDRVSPMLPERISNILCSLRPNEEKLCFAAIFKMDKNAQVLNTWIGRTVIHSKRRFSYEEAQLVLETKTGDYANELNKINELAHILRKQRFENGSINFEAPEIKFQLDETGKPIGVYTKERKDSNMLIEDFMLLANKAVALFVGKEKNANGKMPMVYRIHDLPNNEKLQDFALFAKQFGYKIQFDNPKQIAKALNKLMQEIQGKPEQNMLEKLAIRTMSKAVYTTKNIGHYGLGFEFYSHFTSPIRRYPDVMVHRILEKVIDNQKVPNIDALEMQCKHSSDREKAASEAERTSVKYKMAEYMLDRIGEKFDGVISGVKNWGIYVEIPAYNCEGLLRIETIQSDKFSFDEQKMCFTGKSSKKVFQLGDTIEVILKNVDLEKKQIDFILVE